ncbi:MAG: hypothetical protein ACREB8_05885 [Pseudolabrys sp.]
MKTKNHLRVTSIDPHAAIARANASRAKYVAGALTRVPGLVKRLAVRVHTNCSQRHFSAWA